MGCVLDEGNYSAYFILFFLDYEPTFQTEKCRCVFHAGVCGRSELQFTQTLCTHPSLSLPSTSAEPVFLRAASVSRSRALASAEPDEHHSVKILHFLCCCLDRNKDDKNASCSAQISVVTNTDIHFNPNGVDKKTVFTNRSHCVHQTCESSLGRFVHIVSQQIFCGPEVSMNDRPMQRHHYETNNNTIKTSALMVLQKD